MPLLHHINTAPTRFASPSPSSSDTESNSDTKETHHAPFTYHDTTSNDSFKDALEELSDDDSYPDLSTAKVTHWGGDTLREHDGSDDVSKHHVSKDHHPLADISIGHVMGRTHSPSIQSRESAEGVDPVPIVADDDEDEEEEWGRSRGLRESRGSESRDRTVTRGGESRDPVSRDFGAREKTVSRGSSLSRVKSRESTKTSHESTKSARAPTSRDSSRANSLSRVRSKSPPLPAFTSARRVPTLNLPEGDGGNHVTEDLDLSEIPSRDLINPGDSAVSDSDSSCSYEVEREMPTIDTAIDSSTENLHDDIDHLGIKEKDLAHDPLPLLHTLESHLLPSHDHHHHGVRKKLIRRLSNNRSRQSSESSVSSVGSRDNFSRPVQFINDVGVPDPSWQAHEVSDPEEISAPILPRFESLKKSTKGKKVLGGRKGRRRAAMEEEANGGASKGGNQVLKKTKGKEKEDDGYESGKSRRQSVVSSGTFSDYPVSDYETDVSRGTSRAGSVLNKSSDHVNVASNHVIPEHDTVSHVTEPKTEAVELAGHVPDREQTGGHVTTNASGHVTEDSPHLAKIGSRRSVKIDEPEFLDKRHTMSDPLYRPKPLPERKSTESSRSAKSSKSSKNLPHIAKGVAMLMTGLSPTNSTPASMRESISGSEKGSRAGSMLDGAWKSRESVLSREAGTRVSSMDLPRESDWSRDQGARDYRDASRVQSISKEPGFSREPTFTRRPSTSRDSVLRDPLNRLRSSFRHSSDVSSYPPSMDLNLPQGRTISHSDINIHHPLFHQQQRQHELEELQGGIGCWRTCLMSGCVPWNMKRWHTEADWNSTWGISWPWSSKKNAPKNNEIGGDLRRDGDAPCIRVRGDPGPRSTNLETMDHTTLNSSACDVAAVHSLASRLGDPSDSLYDLADEEADMFEQGQYWGVSGDNPEVRPLSEAASQRGMVLDVIYENQRGMFVFGHPFFSSNSLLNFDRKPWTTLDNKAAPGDPQSYPLPNTNWQWAWKYWYIDMSGDVDDHGWSYSWFFRSKRWHGSHVWLHSWVRRRRWIRVRKAREFNKSEAITGRLERPIKIHDSLLEAKQRGDAHRAKKNVVTNSAAHDFMHAKYSVLVESAASAASWGDFWDVFTACRLDRERTAVIVTCIRNPMNVGALKRLSDNPSEAIDQYQFSENVDKLCARVTQLVDDVEEVKGTDFAKRVYDVEMGHGEGKPPKPDEHLAMLRKFLDGVEESTGGEGGFYNRIEELEQDAPQTASSARTGTADSER